MHFRLCGWRHLALAMSTLWRHIHQWRRAVWLCRRIQRQQIVPRGVKSVIYDCACKNAAYCYRCSVGGLCLRARLCLYLSAVLERLNRDRDAVWDVNSGGPTEPLGWGPDPPSSGRDNFGGAPMRCCFSSKFYDHLLQYIGWQWRNSSSWFSPPSCG